MESLALGAVKDFASGIFRRDGRAIVSDYAEYSQGGVLRRADVCWNSTMSKPNKNSGPADRQRVAETSSAEPAVQVLRQFRLVFNSVKTHFQQVEKKAGLGGAQLWALSVITSREGIGIKELAAAMDIRQPTASNLVKGLADRGLITGSRDGPDRRAVQLSVLPAGKRVLRRAPGPLEGVLPAALASLDRRTLARLNEDLAVLIAVLDADQRAARIPLSEM